MSTKQIHSNDSFKELNTAVICQNVFVILPLKMISNDIYMTIVENNCLPSSNIKEKLLIQ